MESALRNKIFISTRPEGKSDDLQQIIESNGGLVYEMPMIEVQAEEISLEGKEKLLPDNKYEWIIFTSANGIKYFFEHLKIHTGNTNIGKAKIAIIGLRSAKTLLKYGYSTDFINSGNTAKDFAKELKILFGSSRPNVLLPLGNLAGTTIETELTNIANIHRINVYKTVMPKTINYEVLEMIKEDNYAMIIFTSPSAFNNFSLITKDKINIKKIRAACIGPTTSSALIENGIKPLLEAKNMNSSGIANAIVKYYNEQNITKTNF
jgi:uroporphyrinogen-III synthase